MLLQALPSSHYLVPMRILHFVESLQVGGLEKVVVDLVTEQHERGNICMVACLFEAGPFADILDEHGIQIEILGKEPGLDIRSIRKLSSLIKDHKPQVVHTHNPTCNYYAALTLATTMHSTRLINSRHGIGDHPLKSRILYGLSLLRTSWAVGVSRLSTEKIKKEYPFSASKMLTIRNGIVISKFQEASNGSRARMRLELGLMPDALLIAIVARLNPVKNHELLLHAFLPVARQKPDSYLIIIGDGKLRSALEDQTRNLGLEKQVLFLGDRRDIPALLSGMDLFVLSSTHEGYSISLLEACASGLPIIATDVGGNAEIVTQGINGYLVESGNTNALSTALIRALEDKDNLRKMGHFSRLWAEEYGSIGAMADEYGKLYE